MILKSSFIFSLLATGICISCNSAEQKSADAISDTSVTVVQTDTSVLPIATDTSAADPLTAQYNINSTSPAVAEMVRNALANTVFKNDLNVIDSSERKFFFDEIDLNGDGKNEVFVGFKSPYYCGTGGCMALLFAKDGKLITKFTVTEYPITVYPGTTKGWKDLVISSGAAKPTMHSVKWNGSGYPSNPSVQPIYKGLPSDEAPRVLNIDNFPYPTFRF